MTIDRDRSILDERARALAKPFATGQKEGAELELVTFSLGRDRYGIEAKYVRQATKMSSFTRVPRAAPHIAGVTHMGQQILAVIDLSVLLKREAAGITDRSYVLVIGRGRPDFALLADFVDELMRLPSGALDPSTATFDEARAYALGVARGGTSVLDGGALLDAPELWAR